MAKFVVSEAFDVPVCVQRSGAKRIDYNALKELSKQDTPFGEALSRRGVYVFSIRAGRGEKPWYVGRTVNQNFLREAFNYRNRLSLQERINDQKGTLRVTFVTQKRVYNDQPNATEIAEIEYLLIGHAAERNSELINIQDKSQGDSFEIEGVYNDNIRPNRRANHQADFVKMIGLE